MEQRTSAVTKSSGSVSSGASNDGNQASSARAGETGDRPFNVYVKNFSPETDTQKLEELFTEFGTIQSCTVLCDHGGRSKQVGFVQYSAADEAARAVKEMHGREGFGLKPLHVALTNPKPPRTQRKAAASSAAIAPFVDPAFMHPAFPVPFGAHPSAFPGAGWPPAPPGMVPVMVFHTPYPAGPYQPQPMRTIGYESPLQPAEHHTHQPVFPHGAYVIPYPPHMAHAGGAGMAVPGRHYRGMHPNFAPGFCHPAAAFPNYAWAPPQGRHARHAQPHAGRTRYVS